MHTKSRHRLPDAGAPMFAEAIVRGVPETLDAGITSADLGKPEHAKAVAQHLRYIQALEECGLEVTALDADEKYPDSVFIEDTAVVTARCAILARPAADSRRRDGYGVSLIESREYLHLKSGVSYLGDNVLVVAGELATKGEFEEFDRIVAGSHEEYCANCIRGNDYVLVPAGFERTKAQIAARGYELIELEMSEFRKVDGGLSCLSLRLPGRGGDLRRTSAGVER